MGDCSSAASRVQQHEPQQERQQEQQLVGRRMHFEVNATWCAGEATHVVKLRPGSEVAQRAAHAGSDAAAPSAPSKCTYASGAGVS